MMTSSNGNIFCVTGALWEAIHRSPIDSPHKDQWRGALMFSLICTWTSDWANTRDAVIWDAISLIMTLLWCTWQGTRILASAASAAPRLIIRTVCRVQVFSLILDSSVGLSASIQSAGDLVSGVPGSNPAFSRGTQLVSFRFEYRLPVPEHRN